MAINKKLIHFNTKANFLTLLENNNILDISICFIKDTLEIWTHGLYYNSLELLSLLDIPKIRVQFNNTMYLDNSGDISTDEISTIMTNIVNGNYPIIRISFINDPFAISDVLDVLLFRTYNPGNKKVQYSGVSKIDIFTGNFDTSYMYSLSELQISSEKWFTGNFEAVKLDNPTKLSELENDLKYQTESEVNNIISNYYTKEETNDEISNSIINKADISDLSNVLANEVLDEETFPELNQTLTREDLKKDLFDDLWKQAVGTCGTVDHTHTEEDGIERHYYLNELWLTYEEALKIMELGKMANGKCEVTYCDLNIRTVLPPAIRLSVSSGAYTFYRSKVEILNLGLYYPSVNSFMDATKLRKILRMYSPNHNNINNNSGTYSNCVSLTSIAGIVRTFPISFSLEDSPLLDLETFQRIVQKKWDLDADKSMTITVHPDVYAKLTDESNIEWHKVLTDAIAKNISFATV